MKKIEVRVEDGRLYLDGAQEGWNGASSRELTGASSSGRGIFDSGERVFHRGSQAVLVDVPLFCVQSATDQEVLDEVLRRIKLVDEAFAAPPKPEPVPEVVGFELGGVWVEIRAIQVSGVEAFQARIDGCPWMNPGDVSDLLTMTTGGGYAGLFALYGSAKFWRGEAEYSAFFEVFPYSSVTPENLPEFAALIQRRYSVVMEALRRDRPAGVMGGEVPVVEVEPEEYRFEVGGVEVVLCRGVDEDICTSYEDEWDLSRAITQTVDEINNGLFDEVDSLWFKLADGREFTVEVPAINIRGTFAEFERIIRERYAIIMAARPKGAIATVEVCE